MAITRWGIIGPGSIAHNFADGLKGAPSGRLVAIASRDAARRATFGDAYGIDAAQRHDSYAALVADPAVDAVYVSTPHPWHAELALLALRSGKAVVVEKPAGLNAAEVVAVTEAAAQEGRFFMEAYMYRCHPQVARLLALLRGGAIGQVQHIRATFGFSAGRDPASRLYDHALAGGGILDVGGYPVSMVRLIAGVATGQGFDNPATVKGSGIIGPTGVDEVAYGLLGFASGLTAEIACAIARNMENAVVLQGSGGMITLPNPWVPGRNAGPSDSTIIIETPAGRRVEELRHPEHLFTFEAELASRNIAEGKTEADAPAMGHADSIGNAEVLDRWRAELGYVTVSETPATNRVLPGVMQPGLPQIPRVLVDGVTVSGKPMAMSKLVIGCDNRNDIGAGALVWDAWMEAGGNAFDTGFVYGGGLHEAVLGQQIPKSRVSEPAIGSWPENNTGDGKPTHVYPLRGADV